MAEKTYKREMAAVQFIFLGAMFVTGLYKPEAKQIAEFLTLPIFTFGAGAFAIDAFVKAGGMK